MGDVVQRGAEKVGQMRVGVARGYGPAAAVTRRAADRLREGHLWVYRSDVVELVPGLRGAEPEAGEGAFAGGALVTVVDGRGMPLGSALYSDASEIALRVVSRTAGLRRAGYLREVGERVGAALRLRRAVAPEAFLPGTDALRLVFSEADGLPGMVVDRYKDLVILQLLTQGTAREDVRGVVVEALRAGLLGGDSGRGFEGGKDAGRDSTAAPLDVSSTNGVKAGDGMPAGMSRLTIVERADARMRELERLPPSPTEPLFRIGYDGHGGSGAWGGRDGGAKGEAGGELPVGDGGEASLETIFTLNGLRFHFNAEAGQKTGAFLDQRLNYAAAARHGRGEALDVCTYQGGFALHLARGCDKVTGVDASRAALRVADRNLELNPEVTARVDWLEADAFELMREFAATGRRYDTVVLDPPAFAKSKRALEGAMRGYKELNLRALEMLRDGGTLVTCSCSYHVSLEEFVGVVRAAAVDAGRRVQVLETRGAAPDHPAMVTLPETGYLKCLVLRVG